MGSDVRRMGQGRGASDSTLAVVFVLMFASPACASPERPFPLRPPLWRDSDLQPVTVECRSQPTAKDSGHVSCAPATTESSLIWDGADNVAFRPLSATLRLSRGGEAVNVNSLDEVPDSAWFTNRIGGRPMSMDELLRGGCDPELMLDPKAYADGSWVIEAGKNGGNTPGFRVAVPGKGKYLFKGGDHPELPIAAGVIGPAIYQAVGFSVPCERAVRFKPSLLKLTPRLHYKLIFGEAIPLDQQALDRILSASAMGDGTVRMAASAWITGHVIGAFRYQGVRADDPNDVIPHEDRRELRASRLVAAWLNRFDTREGNTLDTWLSERPEREDASPGYVKHYQLDTSESFSSDAWDSEEIARRIGHSYVVDWGDILGDFVTLGARVRPWDTATRARWRDPFGYYDVEHFVPEKWKNEYPNAAFERMTERDGAWMARILARFTPAMVRALADLGEFRNPADTEYLAGVLEGRLVRILERYLTRLSPISDLRLEGAGRDHLCGVDLAARRRLRPPAQFHHAARLSNGATLAVAERGDAELCVILPHVAMDVGASDDAPTRYVRVLLSDGVARGDLVAHLYDLGPTHGYYLAGIER